MENNLNEQNLIQKPVKPEINIPDGFAKQGQKTDFTDDKIQNGFDPVDPDVLAGDNLNKFIDDTYKGLNYSMAIADIINSLEEDEILTVKEGAFQGLVFEGANNSLSNLTTQGEAHFANPNLSNLNTEGETHFDNKYVLNSGDTMTGALKFDNFGVTPIQFHHKTLDSYMDIQFNTNSENERVSTIRSHLRADNSRILTIGINNLNNSAPTGLTVTCDANNNITTTAITTASSDSSTKIATTAFVKSVLSGSGNGLATIQKGQPGYCKFTNGLIIQWGNSSSHQSDSRYTNITYPLAFTDQYTYRVIVCGLSPAMSNDRSSWIFSQTATGCVAANAQGGINQMYIAIGY